MRKADEDARSINCSAGIANRVPYYIAGGYYEEGKGLPEFGER